MQKTKIEWYDTTWNPVMGCTPVSPGCDHCYAQAMIKRYVRRPGWPPATDAVALFPMRLEDPFRWRKPRRIFVCSMGDLFHERVPFDFIAAVFGAMAANQRHTFMVLTKRPERMIGFFDYLLKNCGGDDNLFSCDQFGFCISKYILREPQYLPQPSHVIKFPSGSWPLPNVWLGVTAENQEMANKRIPLLLQCQAAKHFVSVEPMLGPVDLSKWLFCEKCNEYPSVYGRGVVPDEQSWMAGGKPWLSCFECSEGNFPILDWIICGGETGPGARPLHPDWVQSLCHQCKEAEIPFFFKQWGEYRECLNEKAWMGLGEPPQGYKFIHTLGTSFVKLGKKRAGRVIDGRTWDEIPKVSK